MAYPFSLTATTAPLLMGSDDFCEKEAIFRISSVATAETSVVVCPEQQHKYETRLPLGGDHFFALSG